MDDFEYLLSECRNALERFIKFKVSDKFDAEDIIQETYFSAYTKFDTLKNKAYFKTWLISIARNKCNDYFKNKARSMSISLDSLTESALVTGKYGVTERTVITETLDMLGDTDKQIIYLFYFRDLPQKEIAKRLNIPLGTVKSRLHYAKESFKAKYPYSPKRKEINIMKKLPEVMPEYKIIPVKEAPFSVVFEELTNWFIVPRPHQKVSWGSYDMPKRNLTERVHSEVTGRIVLHGVEGVEISTSFENSSNEWSGDIPKHIYYAQLTDTHCRWLGEKYTDKNGVKHFLTFLDGDEFIAQWGFGDENCGNETHLTAKGDIVRSDDIISTTDKKYLLDIVGRYLVEIAGKTYDTVCIMMVYEDGVITEQYVDKSGKTVLWRRFNKNNWAFSRYSQKWTEMLPDNERLNVNGEIYVHWYDCITDYIL